MTQYRYTVTDAGIQITLFAVYDSGQPRKLVLLDLDLINSTSSANGTPASDARPSRRFDVGATLGKQLQVRHLTGGARPRKAPRH